MFERLLHMPKARTILPFMRLSYGSPSRHSWDDDVGRQRTVTQAEGGSKGPSEASVVIHGNPWATGGASDESA